jgi:predicted esterase
MQHKIQVSKTAIYHTKGNIKTAKTIWIVLHGYGMLAEFFIEKFLPILNDNTCIIAPEGLSKFYSKGFHGRVGATWMTKKDRNYEIEDYINYLNQLYETILSKNNSKDVKINVVGFSQGGATASRWIADGKVTPTNFILWSSAFPDEMKFEPFEKEVNTFLLYGDNDVFNTSGRMKSQEAFLKNAQLNFQLITFVGGHDIPHEVLKAQTLKNNWQ